jgi:hypothetical protein
MKAHIRLTDGSEFTAADGAWELQGDILIFRYSYRSGADPVGEDVTIRYSPSAWYSISEHRSRATVLDRDAFDSSNLPPHLRP